MVATTPNAQHQGSTPEATTPPQSGDGAGKDVAAQMGVVQQVQVQAGPAPLPAAAPSTPEGAQGAPMPDTQPTSPPRADEGFTMADFANQEAIRKQAERDVTVSLLGGSSIDGKFVSDFEAQHAMMHFQSLVSRTQGPQNVCTPEHLVAVVEAVRALGSLMDDRALEAAAQKHSLMQLVWKHTQRQGLYLEVLARIWSSPEPRCLLTAPELLPHVEALGGWYCQIYQELRAASKQGAVARLLSRSKVQRKFSMFERVLSEHGDVLAEAMGPEAPAAVSSPDMDRHLKEAAADMAATVEAGTKSSEGGEDTVEAVPMPAASGDLISLASEVITTPTKSTPATAGQDASAAPAAPAPAAPADPFQALAASAPRAASNPFLAQVPEETAAAVVEPAEGSVGRRPSSTNPFLTSEPAVDTIPSRQASGLGSNSAPSNVITSASLNNPFLVSPSAPGSMTDSPVKAAASTSSNNPFLAQGAPSYAPHSTSGAAYTMQATGTTYVSQATGVITTYTYQPTGMGVMASSSPMPPSNASFKYQPQVAGPAHPHYHGVGSTSVPAARVGVPPVTATTRTLSTPASNPFMQSFTASQHTDATVSNYGAALPPLPPAARTGSAASGSLSSQSRPSFVSIVGMGPQMQHPGASFGQGAQQWAAPTPVAM